MVSAVSGLFGVTVVALANVSMVWTRLAKTFILLGTVDMACRADWMKEIFHFSDEMVSELRNVFSTMLTTSIACSTNST